MLSCLAALLLAIASPALPAVDPPSEPGRETSELPQDIPPDLAQRVAHLLGRSAENLPPLRLAEPEAFARALELDALARKRAGAAPDAPEPTLSEAERNGLLHASERTAALYSHGGRELLLRPQAIEIMIERGVVPPLLAGRVLALAVAHEYARAIQDRELGLARFLAGAPSESPVDENERTLRQAVSEGQAMLLLELIAAELGKSDPLWHTAKFLADALSPAALPSDGSPAGNRRTIIYRGGYLWMRDVFAAGGIEATWKLFEAPPRELLRNDFDAPNYSPAESDRLAAALGPGRTALGEGWVGRPQGIQPSVTFAPQLALLDPMERARLLASCRGIASLAAIEGAGGRAALILLRATPGDSALLWREIGIMNERSIRTLGGRDVQRKTHTREDVEVETLRDGAAAHSPILLRARRGDFLFQGSLINTSLEEDDLLRIASRILEAALTPAATND